MSDYSDEDPSGPNAPKEYPNPFTGGSNSLFSTTELRMCFLSASIRSKPQWWEKYKDETIREKWKEEALEQEIPVAYIKRKLSAAAVDWVLKELEEYDRLRAEDGIEVSCIDGIWQSDLLIPSATRSALISSLRPLEDLPESEKDWHPRSDNQVLNLVHPSLYPIVYKHTRAYPRSMAVEDRNWWNIQELTFPWCSMGSISWDTHNWTRHYYVSDSFSWLPTPFEISEDGKSCKISSYINNLDPKKYSEVYKVLEDIFPRFIPMFERVLSDLEEAVIKRVADGCSETRSDEEDEEDEEGEEDEKDNDDNHDDSAEEEKEGEDGGEEASAPPPAAPARKSLGGSAARIISKEEQVEYGLRHWDLKYVKKAAQAEVSDVGEYPSDGVHARQFANFPTVSLRGITLKVIVKLANILLTPEKPTYDGGKWHVEGMRNEAIVSTGIYYYEEENITESKLSFRRAVDERTEKPEDYPQSDTAAVMAEYALRGDGPLNQPLGSVVTKQGRCIAFPNYNQHCVSSFSLVDSTKPGYRKILVFFLVDPTKDKVPDTSIVPPQQADWYTPEELKEVGGQRKASKEEAYKWRLELMDERSDFVHKNDELVFNVGFNMCEH
ncbi:hypothetical protein BT69DRAFT_1299897 [Atractiella rhizophila]|nr:hypothetical protein BT69DRAFT_1299897 [Atractiella rhizophila]